jgi:hypothetical protein
MTVAEGKQWLPFHVLVCDRINVDNCQLRITNENLSVYFSWGLLQKKY